MKTKFIFVVIQTSKLYQKQCSARSSVDLGNTYGKPYLHHLNFWLGFNIQILYSLLQYFI